jgi:hypothetical protein
MQVFPLNAIIITGDLTSTTSTHGIARCKALNGKTVHQALSMQYWMGGKYKRYTVTDLHYDEHKSAIVITLPAPAVANATIIQRCDPDDVDESVRKRDPDDIHENSQHFSCSTVSEPVFDTTPLVPVDDYINGLHDDGESQWFSADAIAEITAHADMDPFIEKPTWGLQIEEGGVITRYVLQPDRSPDDPVVHTSYATQSLTTTDTPFVSHKS